MLSLAKSESVVSNHSFSVHKYPQVKSIFFFIRIVKLYFDIRIATGPTGQDLNNHAETRLSDIFYILYLTIALSLVAEVN